MRFLLLSLLVVLVQSIKMTSHESVDLWSYVEANAGGPWDELKAALRAEVKGD